MVLGWQTFKRVRNEDICWELQETNNGDDAEDVGAIREINQGGVMATPGGSRRKQVTKTTRTTGKGCPGLDPRVAKDETLTFCIILSSEND